MKRVRKRVLFSVLQGTADATIRRREPCWALRAFLAEVPELPGCAADGPSRQEALADAEVVTED
jgi:hypothetical protein